MKPHHDPASAPSDDRAAPGPLSLRPLNPAVCEVLDAQGRHVGNLKRIGAVWKFKAVGFGPAGELLPGGGPLTGQHNMAFAQLVVEDVNQRLLG